MKRFNFKDRQEAWEWAEAYAQGNCSVLVRMGDSVMIFEYLADDFGMLKNRGYW